MKKIVLLVLLVLCSVLLFAETVESKYTYVTYPIYKILQDRKGYVIMTPKPNRTMAMIFVPIEWFNTKVDKAKIQDKPKKLSPVLTVYYKDGEFERLKIVAPLSKGNPLWGMLPNSVSYESKFTQDKLTIE